MPLPFILGAAALAAAGFGVKKGYDGYQTKSRADEILKNAQDRYDQVENNFKLANSACDEALEELGSHQLQIGQEFFEFKTLAEDLLEKINKENVNRDYLGFSDVPKHQLDNIESVSFSALSYLGSLTGAGVVGAGAAYAVYGGVLALGAASTGTSIASLSGAAAYNAAMAAIGGGSLAAGGFGMAGGAMVLGATVAAPILAVAGWAYNSYAEDALDKARKTRDEVDEAVSKMKLAIEQFNTLTSYALSINKAMQKIHDVFKKYFRTLKHINELVESYSEQVLVGMEDQIFEAVENGYKVAAILADLITTPLFIFKRDGLGNVIMEDGIPQIHTMSNGLQMINTKQLDAKIEIANTDINNFLKKNK